MSHEARSVSLVALTLVLAGCSLSHNVVRRERSGPLGDVPRTAPSAREQALASLKPEPPAPHLNAEMIRRLQAEESAANEPAAEPAFNGLGLAPPPSVEPAPQAPAASAAAPAASATAAAEAPAAPEPSPAPAAQPWISGGPWRDWAKSAQAVPAAPEPSDWNDGQDPLRPRRRAEFRFAYSSLRVDGGPTVVSRGYGTVTVPGHLQKYEPVVSTFRLDVPTGFPKRWIIHGWTLATSLEVPFVSTDVPGPDNPRGRELGLGDVTAQAIVIPGHPGEFEWGGGVKASFPTARMEQMGTGRWTLAPTLIGVWHPEWMPNDGFLGLTLRDTFDTGRPRDRDEIHYGTIQPQVQWNLDDHWFLASAPQIVCDFRHGDRWNVPADLMVGKMINENWLVSLDGQYGITNHLDLPDWTVEFRVAFFF